MCSGSPPRMLRMALLPVNIICSAIREITMPPNTRNAAKRTCSRLVKIASPPQANSMNTEALISVARTSTRKKVR